MDKVIVCAPATTANIGPGFDVFAFALDMYNEATFERIEKGLEIVGCPKQYRTERNLAYRAYKAVFEAAGAEPGGVRISENSSIPVARGLGSSASMIAEGAVAANEMLNKPFGREELLKICLGIESHPDNIVACLYGGFTAAFRDGEDIVVQHTMVNEGLKFYAIITDQRVSTEKARGVMPENVNIADAVHNIARAAMIPRAFETGDKERLGVLLEDKLHQPYRSELIEDYENVKRLAFDAGAYAWFISGSGSTCIAMSDNPGFDISIGEALKEVKIDRKIVELSVDNKGASVRG